MAQDPQAAFVCYSEMLSHAIRLNYCSPNIAVIAMVKYRLAFLSFKSTLHEYQQHNGLPYTSRPYRFEKRRLVFPSQKSSIHQRTSEYFATGIQLPAQAIIRKRKTQKERKVEFIPHNAVAGPVPRPPPSKRLAIIGREVAPDPAELASPPVQETKRRKKRVSHG